MGNEIDQDAVEQIDVIGTKIRGTNQEKLGDAPGGLGPPLGIAMSDDLIELGD
jgi:hypothetical protein